MLPESRMTTSYFAPPKPHAQYTPESDADRAKAPAASPERQQIGRTGEPIRAFAFTGGLFDTVMKLGVAHALLVSKAEPPEIAVGVSNGAINAVALAEILQAGSDAANEKEQIEAQVARFREILEAYR